MRKSFLLVLFVLAFAGMMMAQTAQSTVDVLGAHNNGGRGCAGCHSPHSGSFGSGHKGAADSGAYALWGQDASPLYGQTILMGDGGQYAELLPSSIVATGGNDAEIGGILLCLSCHDGNVTASNMMVNQSYEQRIGLLTNTAYGTGKIPTLLGWDGTTGGNYTNDHPVGTNATMINKYGGIIQGASSGVTYTPGAGTVGGTFNIAGGSQYAQFVKNYGYPAIAPGVWGPQFGQTAGGKPFVTCTTCHNQHVMTIYSSRAASPIANDGGGKFYNTFFFINGPYNPNINNVSNTNAPSTTQFCRQCHFGESNEANNSPGISTIFQ